MKSILKRWFVTIVVLIVLLLLLDFVSCMLSYTRFIKEVPGGVIIATESQYIIKIDPSALLGRKEDDLSSRDVFLRLNGTKYGKYDNESYILGVDREGYFCFLNRYMALSTDPVLPWREKKDLVIKEVYLIMTIKEKDQPSTYLIQVIPQKGIIRLMDKPDNK
jgi:hypothetical protein